MPEPCRCDWFDRDVVVTGVAAAASLGVDAEAIWRAMLQGRCGIGPIPEVESVLPYGSDGGQAMDLPAEYRPDLPREARYLRWTIEHALMDASVVPGKAYPAARCSAVLGTTLHGIRAGGRYLRSGNAEELTSFLAGATARLALEGLAIEGGAMTTCSACSSSLGAIAMGVTLLETGQADLIVAGGYDAISEYAWAGFNALRLIAPGPVRPFCRERQGMKVAEGYGVVILERVGSATRREGGIRARLAGWGESADSHHLTQPHPQGVGALTAMRQALERAGVNPAELGLVAAHATGTRDNDASEFHALSCLLGEQLSRVPVIGFKSFLGHTLGGAGAIELVMSCLALRDQRLPACPNVFDDDIEYPGLRVSTGTASACRVSCTLNTSLGFGGANTCVVLTEPRHHAPVHSRGEPGHQASEAWITGVGVVLPGAVGHAAFVEQIGRADACVRAELIDDEALTPYLNARRARRLSPYVKYTLAAATMAVGDAGLFKDPQRLGAACAILGSMHGSAEFCVEYYSQIVRDGAGAANPVLFAEGVPNAAAAHLSATLGLKGACQTLIGTRTAGLDALALGALRVQSGATEAVIVVAAEAPCEVVERAYAASRLGSRPASGWHEQSRRRFPRSFGGVAFVLESKSAGEARGAAPYARVLGSARASPSVRARGGPAAGVASAILRLEEPGRIIGSACGTWVDRAEALGVRRAGAAHASGSVCERFGELYSVTPLVGIATELVGGPGGIRCSALCTDWFGGVSALTFERRSRRVGASRE